MITTRTGVDHTDGMNRWAARRVAELATEEPDLCGYVLKKDSPSCGMERIKTYGAGGMPERNGRGLYAAILIGRFPSLPIEEEGRLSDPRLRENFIERVFAYHRLRSLFGGAWTAASVVEFHTAHKLLLMAHSVEGCRRLGTLVAAPGQLRRPELERRYSEEFMRTMATIATRRRHTNVLQHMAGYFKKDLDAASKAELQSTIDDYRSGLIPLIVPITLIQHHVRVHNVEYLAGQHYLQPHPKELMLRNHV